MTSVGARFFNGSVYILYVCHVLLNLLVSMIYILLYYSVSWSSAEFFGFSVEISGLILLYKMRNYSFCLTLSLPECMRMYTWDGKREWRYTFLAFWEPRQQHWALTHFHLARLDERLCFLPQWHYILSTLLKFLQFCSLNWAAWPENVHG